MYVVLEGSVRLHKGEMVITTLGKGQHFGEMALVDRSPRSLSATANKASRLIAIRRKDFYEIIKKEPTLSVKLLWSFVQVLAERLRKTTSDLDAARNPVAPMRSTAAAAMADAGAVDLTGDAEPEDDEPEEDEIKTEVIERPAPPDDEPETAKLAPIPPPRAAVNKSRRDARPTLPPVPPADATKPRAAVKPKPAAAPKPRGPDDETAEVVKISKSDTIRSMDAVDPDAADTKPPAPPAAELLEK
jgi:hypothetical protein